jgi:hypothetical protein
MNDTSLHIIKINFIIYIIIYYSIQSIILPLLIHILAIFWARLNEF